MKNLLITLIKAYQRFRFRRYPACRFLPSCSEYALIVLNRYPLMQALGKILKRLARCHPWGSPKHFMADPP